MSLDKNHINFIEQKMYILLNNLLTTGSVRLDNSLNIKNHLTIIQCIDIISTIIPYCASSDKNLVKNIINSYTTNTGSIYMYIRNTLISLITLDNDINNKIKLDLFIQNTLSLVLYFNLSMIEHKHFLVNFSKRKGNIQSQNNANNWSNDILLRIIAKICTNNNEFYNVNFIYNIMEPYVNDSIDLTSIITNYIIKNKLLTDDFKINSHGLSGKIIWGKIQDELIHIYKTHQKIYLINGNGEFYITSIIRPNKKTSIEQHISSQKNDSYLAKETIKKYNKFKCLLDMADAMSHHH